MGSNDLVVGEDHTLGASCQRYNWIPAGVARWPLAAHLGEGKLLFQTPAVLRKYPLVEKTSGDNLEEKSGMEPLMAV